MRIGAITPNYYNKSIMFTSKNDSVNHARKRFAEQEDLSKYYNEYKRSMPSAGVVVLGIMMLSAVGNKNTQETAEFNRDVIEAASADSVKPDTFVVKDLNSDNVPELILFKKDNSKMVIDFENREIENIKIGC